VWRRTLCHAFSGELVGFLSCIDIHPFVAAVMGEVWKIRFERILGYCVGNYCSKKLDGRSV
jgi:hypothetical protein